MRLIFLAAGLLAINFTIAQDTSVDTSVAGDSDEDPISRCGNGDPPDIMKRVTQSMVKKATEVAGRTIQVDTYIHIVESKAREGYVTQKMVNDQMSALNLDYGRHGITFKLADVDTTVNDSWATGNYDADMKPALHRGTYSALNLYVLTGLQNNILGVCPFPLVPNTLTLETYYNDGCKVLAGSLPGGDIANYSMGRTATHEIGHWFGLLHTFQGNSCTGDGDFVIDTPPQEAPTQGCPITQDTCPKLPGLDSIHNYMDYSYDECYEEFTPGQVGKLFELWDYFRKDL